MSSFVSDHRHTRVCCLSRTEWSNHNFLEKHVRRGHVDISQRLKYLGIEKRSEVLGELS